MSYAGTLPRWHPAAWNRILANRLEPHARDHPEEVALAHALILGRGERLTESMRDSFRRGGTYHLLVFSGLQIALAAALLAALLRWLPRAARLGLAAARVRRARAALHRPDRVRLARERRHRPLRALAHS